jgi:polyhydroxybutyrate depolymerase
VKPRRIPWVVIGIPLAMVLVGSSTYFVLFRLGATPPPEPPLSTEIRSGSLTIDGLERTFEYFVPVAHGEAPGLVLAFHGGGGSPMQLRAQLAYQLDVLADANGFMVAYPQGYEGHWNTCQRGRSTPATELGIDDVAFARTLIAWFGERHQVDPSRVFAVGFSNGGHMTYRLALEASASIRGAAVVAANQPAAIDSKCELREPPPPLLIINGLEDPINPYDGGELSFHGLWDMGPVMGTEETARSFLTGDRARLAVRTREPDGDGDPRTWVERIAWDDDRVTILAVHGGGHGIPQRDYQFPLAFGPTSKDFNAPAAIWSFFDQHG